MLTAGFDTLLLLNGTQCAPGVFALLYQGRDLHKKATCCSVPLKALSWWDHSPGPFPGGPFPGGPFPGGPFPGGIIPVASEVPLLSRLRSVLF